MADEQAVIRRMGGVCQGDGAWSDVVDRRPRRITGASIRKKQWRFSVDSWAAADILLTDMDLCCRQLALPAADALVSGAVVAPVVVS
jgi:hypothetical protein